MVGYAPGGATEPTICTGTALSCCGGVNAGDRAIMVKLASRHGQAGESAWSRSCGVGIMVT
eukprot:755982-Rhodomonas_salina.6